MQIRLTAAQTQLALSAPITFDVTVGNSGSQPLTLNEPTGSLTTKVHLVNRDTREDHWYALGRTTTTTLGGGDRWALSVPAPQPVELAPNAELRFSTDAQQRLFLKPGQYDAYIEVDGRESNRVPLTLSLTRDAVLALLKTAADANQSYGRREWAMDWLAKVKPGFKLVLSEPSDPAETRQAREVDNRKALEAYVVWWRQQLTRPELDAELAAVK